MYATRFFKALGHAFAVRTDSAELSRHLDYIFRDFANPGEVAEDEWYSLRRAGGEFHLTFGDISISRASDPSKIVSSLLWHINHQVIRNPEGCVLVHAAGAEKDGVGIVMPASMGAGKTTLVAGLVQRGFGYLSDEAVPIDPTTVDLKAYPKPLSIDPGSWELLADLKPRGGHGYHTTQWQVPASSINPHSLATAVPPGLVLLPRYVSGGSAEITRISRGQALLALGESAFIPGSSAEVALRVLTTMVRRCNCYRLIVSKNLNDVTRLIQTALEPLTATSGQRS